MKRLSYLRLGELPVFWLKEVFPLVQICLTKFQMQSFAEQLNEVEMASVITFTRLAWGNERSGDGEIVIPKDIVEYKETNL